MVNNLYRRCFSYKMHMIQNACNLSYKDDYTSWYKCNAKCKECTKESYTYTTKELPNTNSRNQTNTKLPPHKLVKVSWSRGLVKISASWSCVGTWIKAISPTSMLALRKWYLTSMCLVLEWSTGFYATLMALVLSLWSGNGYTPH
jgi:hypothetical protein